MITHLIQSLHSLLNTHPELNLLWAFLAGLLTSFTPCVYPLIPVTLSIFGATSETKRSHSFLLALTYVGGISLTYTTLGMISARTGVVFGSLLGNPFVVLFILAFLILLSLFTLEIIQIDFAYKLQNRASQVGGRGFFGAFLMGTVSGFVAAPCVGPVLVVILGIAATTKSVLWGALLLLSYSLGLGMLFLLIGTYSGLLKKLPRSGDWLRIIKFGIATSLFVVALFLLHSLIPDLLGAASTMLSSLVLGGVALAAFFIAHIGIKGNLKLPTILAAALMAISFYFGFVQLPDSTSSNSPEFTNQPDSIAWIRSFKEGLEKARDSNTPIMMDIYAEWCAACKELDRDTFPNREVQTAIKRFIPVRIDFEGPEGGDIANKFGVVGLPSIIFLRPDGTEIVGKRINQFLPPADFIAEVKSVPIN